MQRYKVAEFAVATLSAPAVGYAEDHDLCNNASHYRARGDGV